MACVAAGQLEYVTQKAIFLQDLSACHQVTHGTYDKCTLIMHHEIQHVQP